MSRYSNLIQNIPLCHSNENDESLAPLQTNEISDNENLMPPPQQLNPVPNVANRPSHINLGPIRPPWEFYTAFRQVEWKHWPFEKSNIDNGIALVDAGHVHNVKEVDKPGSLPVITGICIPQTNIREPPYKLFMEIDVDRKVTKLECWCRDGVICKHGFGLIHYMNTHRDETKTDVSCGFTEPSKGSLILDILLFCLKSQMKWC